MATFVSKDCKAWIDKYALHGRLNRIALSDTNEPKAETAFGNNSQIHKPGLAVIAASYAGFFESDGASKIDDAMSAVRGQANVVVSLAPTTGAAGERCFTLRALQSEIQREGQVGELFLINAAAVGSSGEPPVPGTVLHNATITATGVGAGFNLGPVGAGQKLYAALHVLSASGTSPTLDVVVQSDADGDFSIGATPRITFAQATAAGAQWGTPVSGSITDPHYRISYTVGGTTPSFEFVVVVGII